MCAFSYFEIGNNGNCSLYCRCCPDGEGLRRMTEFLGIYCAGRRSRMVMEEQAGSRLSLLKDDIFGSAGEGVIKLWGAVNDSAP